MAKKEWDGEMRGGGRGSGIRGRGLAISITRGVIIPCRSVGWLLADPHLTLVSPARRHELLLHWVFCDSYRGDGDAITADR